MFIKRNQCDHVDTDACDTLTRMPIVFCRQRMVEGGLTRGGQFRISSLEKVQTECIQCAEQLSIIKALKLKLLQYKNRGMHYSSVCVCARARACVCVRAFVCVCGFNCIENVDHLRMLTIMQTRWEQPVCTLTSTLRLRRSAKIGTILRCSSTCDWQGEVSYCILGFWLTWNYLPIGQGRHAREHAQESKTGNHQMTQSSER